MDPDSVRSIEQTYEKSLVFSAAGKQSENWHLKTLANNWCACRYGRVGEEKGAMGSVLLSRFFTAFRIFSHSLFAPHNVFKIKLVSHSAPLGRLWKLLLLLSFLTRSNDAPFPYPRRNQTRKLKIKNHFSHNKIFAMGKTQNQTKANRIELELELAAGQTPSKWEVKEEKKCPNSFTVRIASHWVVCGISCAWIGEHLPRPRLHSPCGPKHHHHSG